MPERAVVAPPPLLEVDDFKLHFRTPRGLLRAVDGVSFSLQRGRTVGIVGESGCGKTVLGRSILGLVRGKNVVRQGRVLFEGRDVSRLSPRRARRVRGTDIAMVFQDPMTSLNPVMKLGPQLTEGLRQHTNLNAKARRELAVELLRSVGISTPERRLDQYPFELSGGMRQRVTIAIALACGPDLLIADEPTTALDVTIQRQILDLIAGLVEEDGMALILISHDLGVIAENVERTLVMYGGALVEEGQTPEVFATSAHPYTQGLFRARPKLGAGRGIKLATIKGTVPELADMPPGCPFAGRCPLTIEACNAALPAAVELSPSHAARCIRLDVALGVS